MIASKDEKNLSLPLKLRLETIKKDKTITSTLHTRNKEIGIHCVCVKEGKFTQLSVSQILFREGTPKKIVHIPRKPCV